MPNPLNNDLPKRLREVANEFDALCANHGLQYTIESDTHNEQGYLIHGHDEKAASVREYMERFLDDRWIAMEVEPSKHGSYFKFTVQPLYEYSDEVEYRDVIKLAEANAVALEGVSDSDYDDLLIALHLDRWIAPIVVADDLTVIEGLDVLKALVEIGGIHGSGMAPTIHENQYKFPNSRLRRAQAPFSGSSNKPAKTFGGASTEDRKISENQRKGPTKAKARASAPRSGSSNEPAPTFGGEDTSEEIEESFGEYTLIKPLLAHDNTTIIPKGARVILVDNDPELPDVKLEDGRIVNVDMADLQSCIKENFSDRIDRILNENMVAIALPDILGAVGGPPEDEFETASGNMEADFEAPGGPEYFTKDSLLKISMKLDDAIGPHHVGDHIGGSMVDTLNKLWAGELVAILQYEFFYVMAPSLHMAALQEVFREHQEEEWEHARMLTQRISELGGAPVIDLCDLSELAAHGTETITDAAGMVAVLQYQEQIAVESYRAAIKQASDDPATRNMLEQILRDEEEHLSDMESMIG